MSDWPFIRHIIWLTFFRCLPHPDSYRLRVFPLKESSNPRNH